jgi:DNA-binding NtrC family response regulator
LVEAGRYAANADFPILVEGETGTGKEVLAHAIHKASRRAAGPFEIIDCTALTPSLVESELFGHEKGAFTGAQAQRKGPFERANGGTIFMDEIHWLPTDMQAKLLRVLQDGSFKRVGGKDAIRSDFRIIAATKPDIRQKVEAGTFAADLFSRLCFGNITLPRLRERTEDIPRLAQDFLANFCARNKRPVVALSPTALEALVQHTWPSNIRELKATIERSAALLPASESRLNREHIRFDPPGKTQESGGESVTAEDVAKILAIIPRESPAKRLFELLIKNWGSYVAYPDLCAATGIAAGASGTAPGLLMAKMSQLKDRISSAGFSIERDNQQPSRGYRLIKRVQS